MRDTSRTGALRAASPNVDVRRLDVTDPDSIAAAIDGVIRDYGRLDTVFEAAGPYAPQLKAYLGRTSTSFSGAQTSDGAAATILGALTAEQPPFRVQTSDWATRFNGVKPADLDGAAVQQLTSGWIS